MGFASFQRRALVIRDQAFGFLDSQPHPSIVGASIAGALCYWRQDSRLSEYYACEPSMERSYLAPKIFLDVETYAHSTRGNTSCPYGLIDE